MFEHVTEFYKEIKDRLSSPLIFSFLLSWLIFNWPIVIGLFFYKITEVKLDGYDSYIDLINCNTNVLHNLIYPLLVALFYTFGYPFIRTWILAFDARVKGWRNTWIFRLSKTSPVSVEKYVEVTSKNVALGKQLSDLIGNESATQLRNTQLTEALELVKQQKLELDAAIGKMQSHSSNQFLNGKWVIKLSNRNGQSVISEIKEAAFVEFNGSEIIVTDENNSLMRNYKYRWINGNVGKLSIGMAPQYSSHNPEAWILSVDNDNLLKGNDLEVIQSF